jgi:hypothetical protein
MADRQLSYQTLGEICTRMNCGPRRLKKLIRKHGFPAKKICGQYMTTDEAILEWLKNAVSSAKT